MCEAAGAGAAAHIELNENVVWDAETEKKRCLEITSEQELDQALYQLNEKEEWGSQIG